MPPVAWAQARPLVNAECERGEPNDERSHQTRHRTSSGSAGRVQAAYHRL